MIRNIIFDMGNVLVNYEPKEYIGQFADDQDIEILYNIIFNSIEWLQLDRGSISEEDAKSIFYSKLPRRLHPAIYEILENWHENLHEKNEMFYLVKQLKSCGYNIYLLSNTSKRFYHYSKKIPALRYFDGTIISADELLLKPDLAIYKRLLDKYDLKPEQCFFIDDHVPNVEAAVFLGMRGFVYKNNIKNLRYELAKEKLLNKDLQAVILDVDSILISKKDSIAREACCFNTLEDNIFTVKDLFLQLENNGILKAAVSLNKSIFSILEKADLLSLAEIVIDANQMTYLKSKPEIFKMAADKLGVSNESCVLIQGADRKITTEKQMDIKSINLSEILGRFADGNFCFTKLNIDTLKGSILK